MDEIGEAFRSRRRVRGCTLGEEVVLLLMLALAAASSIAAAQEPVVGVVTDLETSAPLSGVYVTLERQGGGQLVSAALTDQSGRFILSAELGAIHRVKAERVGLGTQFTEWFTVQAGAPIRRITMSESAVQLEGFTVRGEVRICRLDLQEATVVQRWWDEVRKALQNTAFSQANDLTGLRFRRYERAWSSNLRALRYERDLLDDSAATRPFLSQDAKKLSEDGFVQGWEGQRLFLAPDAAVLFSETFLRDHCLRVADAEDDELVGNPPRAGELRLEVAPTRDHPADIRGVMTVDTLTGELRSFDFAYANLPADLPRSGAGGHLSFDYLPTGVWIVSDWWIRMPQVEYQGGEGSRLAAVPVVRGYVDEGGHVVDSDGELLQLDRRRGGTLRGVVYDSLRGRPLAGARVSVVGSRLATRTDSAGRFEITTAPSGRHGLTFHDVSLSRMGLPSPVFVMDVAEGGIDSVTLATPGFAATGALLCPDPTRPPSTVVTGRVLNARDGGPIAEAGVRANWVEPDGARSMRSEGTAGADGRYVLCDLPAGTPVTLAIHADSTWRESATVELPAGRVVVEDLRPGAVARSWVRGTVRHAEGGTPISGASVQVLSLRGDTVAKTRTDASGTFAMRVRTDVGYRAVASGEGYLQEASALFSLEGAESLDVAFELVSDPGALAMKIEGIKVEVEARRRAVARNLLRQYGQNEGTLGRRWIGVSTLDSIPATGEFDPGVAISRQGVPGVWVDQASKRGKNPILCVQQRSRRCAIVVLNGIRIDLSTALLIDFRELEGIAILPPQDATTFFGTEAGGGAVILWSRSGGR